VSSPGQLLAFMALSFLIIVIGRSPRRLAMVGGSGGLALIGLGVGMVVTGRRH
jgi:hypothetical protein